MSVIRPYGPDISQISPAEPSRALGITQDRGNALGRALSLGGVVVVAAVAPLLPTTSLKVDATVLAALVLCFAIYIRMRVRSRLGRSSLDLPALAFLLVGVLATVLSANPFKSFFPSTSRGEGLVMYAAYVIIALAAARLDRRQIGVVVTAVLISGSIIGAIALGQYYGVDVPFRAGFRPVTSAQYYGLNVRISPGLRVPNLFGRRSYGTLGNPIFLGGAMSLLLPVGVALAVQVRGRRWWAYAAASTLCYGGLVASQTRAAWVASAGAAVLLVSLVPKSAAVYRRLAVLGIAFATLTAVMIVTGPQALLEERAVSILDPGDSSLTARIFMWKHTIPLIMQRPILGWGFSHFLGAFPVGTPEYFRQFGFTINGIDSPHNDLLHVAFSTGLIGLAAYLAVWAVIAASLRRTLRGRGPAALLSAGLIASLAAYFMWLQLAWNHIGPAQMFWTFAGIAVALGSSGRDPLA